MCYIKPGIHIRKLFGILKKKKNLVKAVGYSRNIREELRHFPRTMAGFTCGHVEPMAAWRTLNITVLEISKYYFG